MLEPAGRWRGTPEWWVDLGCGSGTFTLALAELLGPGSRIVAVDQDRTALDAVPPAHAGAAIERVETDLTAFNPGAPIDGLLMANALHYLTDPAGLLGGLMAILNPAGRVLLVEYDTDAPLPPWVPYPVSRRRAQELLQAAGFRHIRTLAMRASLYGRRRLYSMVGSIGATP